MKRIAEVGMLIGFSVALAAITFALRPNALPWDTTRYELELSDAIKLSDALWIDARTLEDFEAGSYENSLPVNEESWEIGFADLLGEWMPDVPIVVFCSSQSCLRSHHVAERLRAELGVEEVYTLKGGWEALVEAGLVK